MKIHVKKEKICVAKPGGVSRKSIIVGDINNLRNRMCQLGHNSFTSIFVFKNIPKQLRVFVTVCVRKIKVFHCNL